MPGPSHAEPPIRQLVHADRSLVAFAVETCASLCGPGRLGAAALLLCADAGDGAQVLGDHGLDPEDQGAAELLSEACGLIDRARKDGRIAETPDGSVVALAAAAGPGLSVVVIGRRDAGGWTDGLHLDGLLTGATRIAGLALRDRAAMAEAGRTRRARTRTDLARTIHDDVVQRMFGAALALDGEGPLDDELRSLCAREVQQALGDLRGILGASLEEVEPGPSTRCLEDDLAALARADNVEVLASTAAARRLAPAQDAIARSVLAEGLRNARKHADPESVRVELHVAGELLHLTVVNDGVGRRPSTVVPPGIGLRLASTEASQGGGIVEHGPAGPGRWRVRLALPLEEELL
jgi:signal transduction histidine kinase